MKKRSGKWWIIAGVVIVVLLAILIISFNSKTQEAYVQINGNKIKVEIADTPDKQTLGLMFRNSLEQKTGMLFIFSEPQVLYFWMKNTLIPLDMIFIDENGKIIRIERNAQPCETEPCKTYSSVEPARYVLEINGVESDKLGVKEGDKVGFYS